MSNFLRQYAMYSVGVAFNRFAALLLLPLYTRFLTPADFGVLDILMTFIALLEPVVIAGIDTSVQILFYDANTQKGRGQDNLVVTSTLMVAACAGILTIAGYLFAEPLNQLLMGSAQYSSEIQLICMDVFALSLLKLFHDNLRLRQNPLLYSIVSFSRLLLMTGLNILFVVIQGQGVTGYIRGLVLTDVTIMLATGFYVLYHHRQGVFTSQYLRPLLRLGLPLLPVSLALWALSLSDRFFLIRLSTADEVGVYGIANRLAAGIGIFTVAMQIGWRPFALSIQSQQYARTIYAAVPLYYFAVIGWIGLLFATFSPVIIRIFATPAYDRAAIFLPPLLLAQIAYGAYYIFGTGLEITKRTYHYTWAIVLAASINIVLNMLLIPSFEGLGSSLSTAVAYSLAAVLVAITSHRSYPVPYAKRQFGVVCNALLLSYVLVTAALGFQLPQVVPVGLLILLSLVGLFIIIFKKDLQLAARRMPFARMTTQGGPDA